MTVISLLFLVELSQAIGSGLKPSPPLPPKRGIPLNVSSPFEMAAAPKSPTDRIVPSSHRPSSIPGHLSPHPPRSPSPPLPSHIPPEPRYVPLPASVHEAGPPLSPELPMEAHQDGLSSLEAARRSAEHSFGEPHVPPRLPQLPLHILIQQALTSPLPATPPGEGSHRAHSLLFENKGPFEENGSTGRTRSLPVTIEMLKV